MSAPQPLEAQLLRKAETLAHKFSAEFPKAPFEARLQLLEAASSCLGGFDLSRYFKAHGIKPIAPLTRLLDMGSELLARLRDTPIHPSLALSALAREPVPESERKTTGAYYTDFRLAKRLAELSGVEFSTKAKVIDPACGTGILLVALSIQACGSDRRKAALWLRHSVCAADLSANSLRGARMALSSLTDDLEAIAAMDARFVRQDSLVAKDAAWAAIAKDGFDVVIANPPWEKVKLTQHEYLRSTGTDRHYGSKIVGLDHAAYETERSKAATYGKALARKYHSLTRGEPDLYIAFTELFLQIVKPGGTVAALVPAGLIRSQGTEPLRRSIFHSARTLSLSIIDNRARFFSIDTRFKFLALTIASSRSEAERKDPLTLLHERGTQNAIEVFGHASISRDRLARLRPDLTIPEVRSDREWQLFAKIAQAGELFGASFEWKPDFAREVDMTSDKQYFMPKAKKGALAVVEGRMVQQHRFGAKAYVSGTGRSAIWETLMPGCSELRPQHYIASPILSEKTLERTRVLRAGFCDIAGQTNERAMMAALIPPGVVCGNKVPTITFPNDPSEERLLVWTAIANSIPFDWMLRRVLTTTVNYFLLLSLPMPRLVRNGLPWKQIAQKARELRELDAAAPKAQDLWRIAELRADIDVLVALAYGLDADGLVLLFEDFPLLDRNQPPLPGEDRSTITRDLALAQGAKLLNATGHWKERVKQARERRAVPYVYSETAARHGQQPSERDANVG